jgi:hypothetical protein
MRGDEFEQGSRIRGRSSGSRSATSASPVSGRTPSGMRYSSRALSGRMPIIWWTDRSRAVASRARVALASPRSCSATAFGWPFRAARPRGQLAAVSSPALSWWPMRCQPPGSYVGGGRFCAGFIANRSHPPVTPICSTLRRPFQYGCRSVTSTDIGPCGKSPSRRPRRRTRNLP